MPAVITMAVDKNGLYDGVDVTEACKRLEENGASVVGLNCYRGPETMLPLLKEIRKKCKVKLKQQSRHRRERTVGLLGKGVLVVVSD